MKKFTKRIWAVVLAAIMVMVMAVTVMAAGTGAITIFPPDETDASTTTTYSIYKVFDADGNGEYISYKLPSGKTLTGDMTTYFEVDAAGNVLVKDAAKDADGNLTSGAIEAIAAFIQGDTAVATVTANGTKEVQTENLPNGYYYATTTTGTAVSITSTNPRATVRDKNTATEVTSKKIVSITDNSVVAGSIDENGENALAQLGSTVSYSVEVTWGRGGMNIKLHDTFGSGLSYNNDVTVAGINTSDYTIQETPDSGDTLTISFKNNVIEEGRVVTITYSATVVSDTLTDTTGKNTATVTYGNGYQTDSKVETHIYNAEFTVTSKDGDDENLAGAGFILKNAAGKYYQKNNNTINWIDSIDDATEYRSDAQGAVTAFTGLANGTYTLVEKTAPSGYNKAPDHGFTIKAASEEGAIKSPNLKQSVTIVNNSGSLFPNTGGMGTTIFYVVGAILVLAAGVLLITHKKMSEK